MKALLIVLDSVGCGGAPDAADYGDTGADTLGHLFANIPQLELPHLASLGLYDLLRSQGKTNIPWTPLMRSGAEATLMTEASAGKDTTTGHWELAGCILEKPFATFTHFPAELIQEITAATGVTFIGNIAASGTEIIKKLGEEHLRSGHAILYTSADSVMQIAAHEDPAIFGLAKLLQTCAIARHILDAHHIRIGRVIARPFTGTCAADFTRTSHRHDYSLTPPHTVWKELQQKGIHTIGVGKVADIYADLGIAESHPTASNREGMHTISRLWREHTTSPTCIIANLVDFDMHYGHRRNPLGYAQALRDFDTWLGNFIPLISKKDLLIITADHGNDPYHPGTDHTREKVPLLTLHSPTPLYPSDDFTQVAHILRRYFAALPPHH